VKILNITLKTGHIAAGIDTASRTGICVAKTDKTDVDSEPTIEYDDNIIKFASTYISSLNHPRKDKLEEMFIDLYNRASAIVKN
jgi:hypothetical protein